MKVFSDGRGKRRIDMAGTVLALAVLTLAAPPSPAWSQQARQGQQNGSAAASLPPALQAAFSAGNSQQIAAAIATLSGGNPTVAASLSASLLSTAEAILATDPMRAIQAAAAAVQAVRATAVATAAPQQTESVLTQAARIFVAPTAQRVAPELTASVAAAAISVAVSTGNPTLVANVSANAMRVAESVLSVNPAAAVQIASQAMQAVGSSVVQQSSPQQVMAVATSAARIIVNPEAQRVSPQAVGAIAGTVATVVSSPAVYQSALATAIQAMANSYAAAQSTFVASVAPSASREVARAIADAGKSNVLSQVNPNNPSEMNRILNNSAPVTASSTQTDQQQTGTQTPQVTNPNNDASTIFANASPS